MKRFGKLAGFFLASVIFCLAGAVVAAQLSSSNWYRAGSQYGRSDGVYQHRASNALMAHIDGKPQAILGKAFTIDFTDFDDGDQYLRQEDGTAAVGTTAGGDGSIINHFTIPSGLKFAFVAQGTQTLFPDMDAGSLDIGADQTDDEGYEIYMGLDGADGAPFVVGYDPAFYTCATVAVADVSGTDDLWVGFRRAAFAEAAVNSYSDYAMIGPIAGDIYTETDLNASGSEVSTDTTLNYADAGTAKKYCVKVSAAGVTTYTVDGTEPPTVAAFTFDDGDMLIPFITNLQAATLSGEIDITLWEAGYQ